MTQGNQEINVRPNGPYLVRGGVPLVRKSQVMSEYGEPLDWQNDGPVDTQEVYALCRCGQSKSKPFCDGSHSQLGFESDEAADTSTFGQRKKVFEGPDVEIKDDHSLCMHSGFCGTRLTNVWNMLKESQNKEVRDEIIAMVQRCPSGTLVHALSRDAEGVEADLPKEIAVIPMAPYGSPEAYPSKCPAGSPWRFATGLRCAGVGRRPKNPCATALIRK